jgi:SlyX protein
MSEAIERLEVKIAYLEAANAELSDVVYRQQKEFDALKTRFAELTGRFEELAAKPQEWTAQDEKPPHY